LVRLDQVGQGIELLKQVASKTNASFMEPYYDLAVIFMEQNRWKEARDILDLGCEKSDSFLKSARPLYKQLRTRGVRVRQGSVATHRLESGNESQQEQIAAQPH
jgi:hypothetical protein